MDEAIDYISSIFQNYNIIYNDLINQIMTNKNMTIAHMKEIMLSYSRNNYHDASLWNYLTNCILMHILLKWKQIICQVK